MSEKRAAPANIENPISSVKHGGFNLNTQNHNSTICLVDDDPSVLKSTGRLLSSAGWKVESFSDPGSFLRHAEANHPPLAVLDIWMPSMNGLEVQKRLRLVSPETCVIVLTSKDDPSVRSRALAGGASAFFLKPAPEDAFLKEIESCLSLNAGR